MPRREIAILSRFVLLRGSLDRHIKQSPPAGSPGGGSQDSIQVTLFIWVSYPLAPPGYGWAGQQQHSCDDASWQSLFTRHLGYLIVPRVATALSQINLRVPGPPAPSFAVCELYFPIFPALWQQVQGATGRVAQRVNIAQAYGMRE